MGNKTVDEQFRFTLVSIAIQQMVIRRIEPSNEPVFQADEDNGSKISFSIGVGLLDNVVVRN